MIAFTTEVRDGVTVVRLFGTFAVDEAAAQIAEQLEHQGPGGPLIVDLSEASPIPGVASVELLARLEASPRHTATVLVHEDLEARRALRSISRRLPVVPDVEQAVGGRFPAALAPRHAVTTAG